MKQKLKYSKLNSKLKSYINAPFNTKTKSNKSKVADVLSWTFVLSVAGSISFNIYNATARLNGADKSLFMKTPLTKLPQTLHFNPSKPIDVIVDSAFTLEQKNAIAQAIDELDLVLQGVDYNVILDAQKSGKNCINIFQKDRNPTSNLIMGLTEINARVFSGQIVMPINMELYTKAYEDRFMDSKFEKEYFQAVVKHEMLHTLGLDDLTNYNYRGKSIMYEYMVDNLWDLTPQDIETVNKVYTPKKSWTDCLNLNNDIVINKKEDELTF